MTDLDAYLRQQYERGCGVDIHIQAEQGGDDTKELIDAVTDRVTPAGHDVYRGLEQLVEAPDRATVVLKTPWEAAERMDDDEWASLRRKLAGAGKVIPKQTVVVAERLPSHFEELVDLRVRERDGEIQWTRIHINPYAGDTYEKQVNP